MVIIRNVSELRVSIPHIRALGQGTRYSNVNDSFLPQPTLLAEASIAHRIVTRLINTAFRQSVHSQILFSYHLWLRSIILQPTAHFNQYMHNHSLAQAQPLQSKSSITNHNSTFNTLRKLQKYSTILSTWSQYYKNPDTLAPLQFCGCQIK